MRIAVKTKDLNIISFTMRGIIRADRYFTLPGVVVITAGGILSAVHGNFPIFKTGWILWSIILFTISGLAFGLKVAPLQSRILRLAEQSPTYAEFDWNYFIKQFRSWEFWGLVALLTPVAAVVLMTLKIPV